MIRLTIRGYVCGVLRFEEPVEVDESVNEDQPGSLEKLGEEHTRRLLALPGGDRHMIEIEFLDEPNQAERFFRFGTDPALMRLPLGFRLGK